ncbi:secretin N-terminal domain-containing protein [Cerasicoccus arenae]|uniref:secretin N-terminal domain-containing protein n=1 Tax=Cerasicoccus arenae TaxID=424488 RepID=UPI001677788B|nr:secretin N-terminal domain-containing protein [Cerasicoccus arenae]MBK1857810.1 hypothetical protein [Cerasicoccus arenae]
MYLILLALLWQNILLAAQKSEVFTLENRDAASLVPVIGSTFGPDVRVTADVRTNSLIISYPEEMQGNVRTVVAQLDLQEPNIVIEVVTFEVKSEWMERLGLTVRNSLNSQDYASLLPLLIESEHAILAGRQRVVVRNNTPAQISLQTQRVIHHQEDASYSPRVMVMAVIPRLLGKDIIEVKLAHVASSLAGDDASGVTRVFSTVSITNGGAQVFTFNESKSQSMQMEIPIFPLGIRQSNTRSMERVVFLNAKTIDYKDSPTE